jgi:hypothetical protein
MTSTVTTLSDIAHVTPITCPACGTGKARLVERHCNDGLERNGKSEIWVFQCDTCEATSVQPVDR